MKVIYYPSAKDSYQQGNIAAWAKNNKCNYVIEIHRNAGGGVGSEILIKGGSAPDKMDKAIYNSILKQGYKGRGIKARNDLANINRMASSGISYSLIEVGFIDSKVDNAIFDKTLTTLGNDIYTALSNVGVKTLGVVYGHGQGDPGATKFGRQEAKDVRKIKIKSPAAKPSIPKPKPKPTARPKATIKGEKVMAKPHKYVVTAEALMIRISPSANASTYSKKPKFLKGETFIADSYIDANGYRWLVVRYAGIKYFVAESTLKNKKSKYVKDITK